MKRYASCYCRYSSDRQQQQSIEYQLERIEEFCNKYDITLVEKYIDEAQTGTNDQRKDFQRMIEDSEQSKWSYLLVYNLSRLARNVEDQMFYQKLLKQRGIMIVSVEEKFDSTPEGHLFALITAGINEYYSKHLSKRSFAGIMQNAKKCLVIGGIIPLGFDVDENKRYVINEKEAESVRIIFQKTLEGWSHPEIRKYLNERGYVTKLGNPFGNSLYEILRNRKYIGEYTFNYSTKEKSRHSRSERANDESEIVRIPGGLPQIVDKEVFDKVQHLLNRRSNKAKMLFKPTKYLLSGLASCGKCFCKVYGNSTFNSKSRNPWISYTHENYRRGDCETKDIPAHYVDQWIKTVVIPQLLDYRMAREKAKEINEPIIEERNKIKMEIKEIEKKIQEIESQISNRSQKSNQNSYALFADEDIADLRSAQSKLKRTLREKNARHDLLVKITAEKWDSFIHHKRNAWESAEDQEKIILIKEIISNVIITNEEVTACINYDTITNKLCDFEIKIASIEKSKLMKL